eukprot:4217225-Amphidinium_carterae.1
MLGKLRWLGRKTQRCSLFASRTKCGPHHSSGLFGALARRRPAASSDAVKELLQVHLAETTPPPGGPTKRRPPKLFSQGGASKRRDAPGVPTRKGISSPSS